MKKKLKNLKTGLKERQNKNNSSNVKKEEIRKI